MSLSEISFYRDDSASVSVPDQPATEHTSSAGAATSDGLPQSEINSAAGVAHSSPHAQREGAKVPTQSASRVPAEQPAQQPASPAQQHVPAPVRVSATEAAAGASQLSSPCESTEPGADPAGTPHNLPSPPSLQSWGNNTNDQCSLASKSVSLDLFLAAGGASPRRSNTFRVASPGPVVRKEPEQVVSLQQQPDVEAVRGDEVASSAAKQAQAESSPALHHQDNAPAFWEGRRRSSSGSNHVHGSSAALSALAQAYSRAGQGSPAPAQGAPEAQAQQVAASERSPMETSELLRVMAMKIDSQSNLHDMELLSSPALPAGTGACSTPSDLESGGAATGAVALNAPQKGPVSEQWGYAAHPGPSNPFAAACKQTDLEAKAQTQLSQAPSRQAGLGSAGLPAKDAEAEKSVAALSMRCEAGSCIAPTSQCSPFESGPTVSQGRSNAHSSPDSWNGNASPGAIARAGAPSMLTGGSSGRLTPLDRSQHSTGRSRLAGRTSSQLSGPRQPGINEGVWDSQRSQQQGTSGSAPNSGSNRKSSALEDSAKESICPAELETMERAWVAMGGNASAAEKLRQQAAWQKQTFNPRDSAASGQAEGPYASAKGMRNFQRAQSTSRPSDAEASCENQAGSRVPLSRSGKSGLSVACTPVSDGGYFESGGSGGSRLTANNLTEFDNLQRQVSRKDKPRSPLHERTHAWLAQTELPAEFEYSAKRAAKLKERCDSYSAKMSNPFDTRKEAAEAPRQPMTKKPNVFKRFIACITIEPW